MSKDLKHCRHDTTTTLTIAKMLASLLCTSGVSYTVVLSSAAPTIPSPSTTPSIVFSCGLFNTMPSLMYRGVINRVRENVTIHTPPNALTRRSFEQLCDDLEADKMPLVIHSSFDSSILGSHRLERALLIDPATAPALSVTGLVPMTIQSRAPVHVIKSKLYDSFVPVPFRPKVTNAVYTSSPIGGHSDFLDPVWTRSASALGIPSDHESCDEFRDYIVDQIVDWSCGGVYV